MKAHVEDNKAGGSLKRYYAFDDAKRTMSERLGEPIDDLAMVDAWMRGEVRICLRVEGYFVYSEDGAIAKHGFYFEGYVLVDRNYPIFAVLEEGSESYPIDSIEPNETIAGGYISDEGDPFSAVSEDLRREGEIENPSFWRYQLIEHSDECDLIISKQDVFVTRESVLGLPERPTVREQIAQTKVAQPSEPVKSENEGVQQRERTSYLKIIRALLNDSGTTTTERDTVSEIRRVLEKAGLPLDDKTIRKIMNETQGVEVKRE